MDWKDVLGDVDDDYLVGLSNKGIVKRAYKDKADVPAEIEDIGEEAVVRVGDEKVTVRSPLGESKCTCPSRSMCRHVVQAILVLRESCLKETPGEGAEAGTAGTPPEGAEAGTAGTPSEGTRAGTAGTPPEGTEAGKTTTRGQALWREIREYPLGPLKKILGARNLQSFVNLAAAGVKPEIKVSSVVTLQLPLQEFSREIVVKLLSPLEYSSCTCHKKELCVHKAAAILWCQLEDGALTEEGLNGLWNPWEADGGQVWDMDGIKADGEQMKRFLEELLATGLSRTSPDALDYLERLAIVSHNRGLARFEGYFRALSDSYDRYFKRKASFKTEELMGQLTRLYRRVDLLLKTEDSSEVLRQAGEFRADYLPAGNLNLIGITLEHFESKTGYEGETVYFLEEKTKEWYTYTNARPVFYDSQRKRGYAEKSPAPWGLNLSMEDLSKVRIQLTGAKCDNRKRLSASQDTRGQIWGERKLELSDIEEWYYRDFGKLYRERIDKPGKWLLDREELKKGAELVWVHPDSWAKAEFSAADQVLSMPLYDGGGREMVIEVEYSKKEDGTIKYLEKISQKKVPCFLGKLYLREGRMRLYPVDVWDPLKG